MGTLVLDARCSAVLVPEQHPRLAKQLERDKLVCRQFLCGTEHPQIVSTLRLPNNRSMQSFSMNHAVATRVAEHLTLGFSPNAKVVHIWMEVLGKEGERERGGGGGGRAQKQSGQETSDFATPAPAVDCWRDGETCRPRCRTASNVACNIIFGSDRCN